MNALTVLPPAEDEAISQAEAAYRQLRDKLIMLEIRPGEPINDGQLAAELGFGRTPVREAIKRLEATIWWFPTRAGEPLPPPWTSRNWRRLGNPGTAGTPARRAGRQRGPTPPCAANCWRSPRPLQSWPRARRVPGADALRHDGAPPDLPGRRQSAPGGSLIRYDNLATRIWCLVLDKVPSVSGHIASTWSCSRRWPRATRTGPANSPCTTSPASRRPSARSSRSGRGTLPPRCSRPRRGKHEHWEQLYSRCFRRSPPRRAKRSRSPCARARRKRGARTSPGRQRGSTARAARRSARRSTSTRGSCRKSLRALAREHQHGRHDDAAADDERRNPGDCIVQARAVALAPRLAEPCG